MAITGGKTENRSVINERANQSAKRAKQLPEGVQYAITVALPHICNGAFWGFTSMKSVQEHIKAIKEAAPNITARQLGNSCLIEVEPGYLIKAVQAVDPNALTQSDLQNIQTARAEAHIAFEKFLIARGKGTAKTGKPFEGTIGVYCINDVTTISSKGVNYPAFRLSLPLALQYLAQYGYSVKVNGSYMRAQDAANAGQALWSSLGLAPTKTGVFMDICSYFTPEQYAQLDKNFRQRMGVQKR